VADGEVLSELQLLEGVLVASANNVAPILAQYDAGSQAAFVATMNGTAQALGMSRTTYTDPSGLDPTTVSTAADQLRLAKQAMANPVFARIVDMRSVNLPVAGITKNFNTALGTGGFIGVKSGSDSNSGGCLIFAYRQAADGHPFTILGVVLGQDVGQDATSVLIEAAIQVATSLVHSVNAAVALHTVLAAGTAVATVINAAGHRVSVRTTSAISILAWGGQSFALGLGIVPLGHHLASGQDVASVSLESAGPARTSAAAASSMPAVGWGWRLRHVF